MQQNLTEIEPRLYRLCVFYRLDEYPDLELQDIQQALRHAAWAADDIIYVPSELAG